MFETRACTWLNYEMQPFECYELPWVPRPARPVFLGRAGRGVLGVLPRPARSAQGGGGAPLSVSLGGHASGGNVRGNLCPDPVEHPQ